MSLKLDLAKSWDVSKDGLVYDIFLRDDILWHDGVKFSIKNPKNNSFVYVNFEDIKSVEILNLSHEKSNFLNLILHF